MMRRISSWMLALVLLLTVIPTGAGGIRVFAAAPKLIAFTFDDGPSIYTAGLLDGLKERGASATFFMTGVNGSSGIVNQSQVLERMVNEGHQLANHTYSHIVPFNAQSAATISSQVSRVEELLFQSMGGSYTDMVRTPGGAVGGSVKSAVAAPIITWNVDTLDWKYRDAATVCGNILSTARDGAIVLLHDLYSTSVQGALRAMDTLKAQGYEFVTVAELLRRRGITPESGKVYSGAPDRGINLPPYSAPSVSSSPGTAGVQVFFTSPDGLPLYYTTDGTLPNLGSSRYTGPITITADTTFTVAGIDQYGTRTRPVTQKVAGMPRAAAPRIFYENGLLTLSASSQGTRIFYTTDGSQPSAASTLYTGSFAPAVTTKCVAAGDGFLDSPVVTCTLTPGGSLFTDVGAEQWYYDGVGQAVDQGWMAGTGSYTFAPNAPMTRGMLAVVLYSLEGRPVPAGGAAFSDVPEGAWYGKAVQWASQTGVAAGRGDGTFGPQNAVTRQELAQMLYNYAGYKDGDLTAQGDLSAFPDGDAVAGWAETAMVWASGSGLINGHKDTGLLDPGGAATRAQTAAILKKLAEL